MYFAGILNNEVICKIDSNSEFEFPPLLDGTKILTIPCSELTNIGDKYLNGIIKETGKKKLTDDEYKLVIMENMAYQYEETLERDLVNKDVLATIYETILENGSAV